MDLFDHLRPPPAPERAYLRDDHDPRLGDLIRPATPNNLGADVVLLGCEDETGLLLNRGRPGARQGPNAIRAALHRLTPGCGFSLADLDLVDAGNLRAGDGQQAQELLAEVTQQLAARARTVVLLGGSHELSFPGIRGYAAASGGAAGAVLVDAHLDVRDLRHGVTNGTPFFSLLEQQIVPAGRFTVVGAQQLANAAAHYEYLRQKGAAVVWLEELGDQPMARVMRSALARAGGEGGVAVSVDIDAAAQAVAPGTGAPCADGLDAGQMVEAALEAGRHPRVGYLDVMEVSPRLDPGGQTALLAASMVHGFMQGVLQRVVDQV